MSNPYLLGATQIVLGASTITQFNAGSFLQGFLLKKVTTGVTVMIVPGITAEIGYPIADNEVIAVGGPANFFLATQGATATVALTHAFSAGATGLPTLPPANFGLL